MRARRGRIATWLAVALFGACLAMVGFSLLSVLMPTTPELPDRPNILNFIAAMSVFIALPTVGLVLAIRRPENPIGWLFLVCGAGFITGIFSTEYVGRVVIVGMTLPAAGLADWMGAWIGALSISLALIWIPLLFPDGRLVGPRWLPLAWVDAVFVAAGTVAAMVLPTGAGYSGHLPNPIGASGPVGDAAKAITDAYFPIMVVLGIGSLASLVVRFRRSRGVERQQLKWFIFAGTFLIFAVILAVATQSDLAWYAIMFGLASLPVAAGIAILRYRLYDIDRLVSRTIAYALVTGALVAVYLMVNLGLTTALSTVARTNSVAVATSTLVVAALFTPLRRRIQRLVDHRFDRARYDAERTTSAFSDRLRDEVDLTTVASDLDRTVRTAIAPTTVGVWLRGGP